MTPRQAANVAETLSAGVQVTAQDETAIGVLVDHARAERSAEQVEALRALRWTLETFHAERETVVRAGRLSASGPIRMVSRLTPQQMTDALNALAELERATPKETP